MAITYTTRLQLPKQDVGELGWGVTINTGFQSADDRFFLSGAGSPTGVVTSQYIGQRYWDTTNSVWYTATAAGVSNAWAKSAEDVKYVYLDGTRTMAAGLRHPNNVFLQFRNQGDTAWRALLGIDAADVAKLGHASHGLTLIGSSFASLLALMGGVSRRIIVANASDENDADTLNSFDNTLAGNLVSGGTGVASSWQSYLKLPILISGNPVVVNFGHQLAVPADSGVEVTYAYTYLSTCHFTGGTVSSGAYSGQSFFFGTRIGPGSTPLTKIKLNHISSTGTVSMFWLAIGV